MASAHMLAAWYDIQFLNNKLWQWTFLLGLVLGSLIVGRLLSFFLEAQVRRLRDKERLPLLAIAIHSADGPIRALLLAGALYAGGILITFQFAVDRFEPGQVREFYNQVCTTIALIASGWFIYRLVDVVEHFLHKWTSRTDTALDNQLVPLIRKTLRVFVVVVIGLFIAQNVFHWNIGALVAGLGVGGLAVALAAQTALSNLFGSITIFTDRPFVMGNWVKMQGYEGIVEEVGFRSTRIRTFEGHLVTIPNSVVASGPIDNVARRPHIRRILNVTVTYDTPPEKLRRGIEIIREMLDARKEHLDPNRPSRVFFNDYNAASLNIIVAYWYQPPDWWQSVAFAHDFNMELLERFNAEGIEFAFPTQTLYLKQDSEFSGQLQLLQPPESQQA
ncbi:MAG: mechanosensitive ion channel family protein [Planctomycetota bacterium]